MKKTFGLFGFAAMLTILCISTTHSLARIGEGPTIGQLISGAPLICCGRMSSYMIVPDAKGDGSNMVMVVRTLAIDHLIKGTLATNEIWVFQTDRLSSDESAGLVRKANLDSKTTDRLLVFLRPVEGHEHVYKLVADEIDAMAGAARQCPAGIAPNAGIEERIEAEILGYLDILDERIKDMPSDLRIYKEREAESVRDRLNAWKAERKVAEKAKEESKPSTGGK